MGHLTISTNVRRYQTHYRRHFSFRKTAHWCTCIVYATQSNCCGALDFLYPEPCTPTAPSWTHWLQDLGSNTAAWVWVVSQKDCQNSSSHFWFLQYTDTAFEWKNAIFVFPHFAGSVEAQVIWGGTVKCLLIAYFIGNNSAKKYQNAFQYRGFRAQRFYLKKSKFFRKRVFVFCKFYFVILRTHSGNCILIFTPLESSLKVLSNCVFSKLLI